MGDMLECEDKEEWSGVAEDARRCARHSRKLAGWLSIPGSLCGLSGDVGRRCGISNELAR